jgi:D-alanine-D-alanine ligase
MPAMSLSRVIVVHNTDYDAELTAGTGVDVSAVLASAMAIADALAQTGVATELVGIHGTDLFATAQAMAGRGPDLVFNLCESLSGDSRNETLVPGVFELLGLPYTGSDALALGSCLHKDRAKDILRGRGVPTPPARLLTGEADLDDPTLARLDYPWFLKLVHEDASVGIEADNLVRDHAALVRRPGS